jgi:ABC-2 type transport system permease protein
MTTGNPDTGFPPVRFCALLRKESLQILRDPSALAVAFVLPVILLFLFAFAVSLDVRSVPFGVVLLSDSPQARDLAAAYAATPYLQVYPGRSRQEMEALVRSGKLKGFVVIPADFERLMLNPEAGPAVQIISDGSSPNSANFSAAYATGVFTVFLQGHPLFAEQSQSLVEVQQRFWFNPELDSRRVLVPGAIALVMTMIGTLLTAMVVAREWERGTMEAIMSTRASMIEIILSKLLPYFLLGSIATVGCVFLAVSVFGIPMEGSIAALMLISAVFLFPALGQGLLISTLARNQFRASMYAMLSGYLPAMLLSGFIFEINSMPWLIQKLTAIIPARYYVNSLKTVFLAGDIWPQLLRDMLAMLAIGSIFFAITIARSKKRLD